MSRQIVLDTETTGLSAESGDRVIELACVELVNRKLTGNNLHFYFNPDGRSSSPEALAVHNITDEFLLDKPRFGECADEIMRYLEGAEIIIHNAAFDVGFLNKELELVGKPALETFVGEVTDTLVMSKQLYPGKRNSLDALCDRLGVDNSRRTVHSALVDTELLADVYINLTRGQEALLIDLGHVGPASAAGGERVDLSGFDLPVLAANAQELAAHEEALAQIDKSSGGKTVWRLAEAPAV